MKLYNSLTQSIDPFKPHDPDEVKMYVCGITPYDTTHLGHAFTYTVFDVLYRVLEAKGYKVNYTQNVTDIDDDILKKAKQVGEDWIKLGKFWTDKFVKDNKTLNNIPPTHYVKATETIPEIIEIVTHLIDDGFAYEKKGNVYFRVQKDKEYGKLSRYTRAQMILLSKDRGANPDDPNKEDPLDFILWQKSKSDEPFWESPLTEGTTSLPSGRPGWHIECSAMNYKYLGKKIDIHGGGSDLKYPHHESEIAQSEQFTGEKPFSQFWLHTGAVMYECEKMSKSLGNLVMVSELLKTYSPNAIRYLLLSNHYRKPWEYEDYMIAEAQKKMDDLEKALKKKTGKPDEKRFQTFIYALENDLDTPKALEILERTATVKNDSATARKMARVLGFLMPNA